VSTPPRMLEQQLKPREPAMSDEVQKMVPLDLLRRLVAGARECAEDVLADADAKYPEATRAEQPTAARRYMRDTTTALVVLDLVSRLEPEL
jgi:hypothetical protein